MPRNDIGVGIQRPAPDVLDHIANSETTNLHHVAHFLTMVGAVFLLAAAVLALVSLVRSDMSRWVLLRYP
jgi:hypothetical protein